MANIQELEHVRRAHVVALTDPGHPHANADFRKRALRDTTYPKCRCSGCEFRVYPYGEGPDQSGFCSLECRVNWWKYQQTKQHKAYKKAIDETALAEEEAVSHVARMLGNLLRSAESARQLLLGQGRPWLGLHDANHLRRERQRPKR